MLQILKTYHAGSAGSRVDGPPQVTKMIMITFSLFFSVNICQHLGIYLVELSQLSPF